MPIANLFTLRLTFLSLTVLSLVAPAAPLRADEIAVGDVTLDYEETGSGTPVVFVHGAISDRRVWGPYRDTIAPERRFVAYDQRYFGTRDWPDDGGDFSADTHAADLIAVVEALDAGPAGLVAWSYGGDVAARAAVARPELFSALVLYEPDIYGLIEGVPGSSAATESFYDGFDAAFSALEEGRLEDASLRFIEAVFDLSDGAADSEPDQWRAVWRQNGRTIPLYLDAPAGDVATCADLATVRVPTLIVKGAASTVYDVMMAERTAGCAGNAVVASLPDANHDGPYRQPQRFAAMIDSFLDLAAIDR